MCGNDSIPGFRFNPIAAQLCSRYDDGLNLMWNAGMMSMQTKAMLTQFPSANRSVFSPFAWQSNMDYLLDPRYTMMQFNQQYGGYGGFNLLNGSFNFADLWKNVFKPNNNNNNGGSNGSNGGSAPTVEGKKLNAMKQVFERLKEASEKSPFLSAEILNEYNEALKAEGEKAKVEALEKVFKKINPAKLRQAILADSSVAELLKQSGYNMSSVKYYKADEKDADWKKIMSSVSSGLNSGNKKGLLEATGIIKGKEDEILQAISAWNDNNDTKFLKAIAAEIPSKVEEQENWKDAVNSFVTALTELADEYADYSSVKTKKEAVEKALKAANNSLTKANVEALSDKFDALYAELRVIKAQEADKYIKENFGFINNLKEGAAPEGEVLKETKADLTKEGLSAPSTVLVNEDENEDEDVIKPSAKEGVYETKTTSSNANKKFYTKDGDKILELKDVKAIDEDGNCTMIDGSTKSLADVQEVEVSDQDIKNYQETVKTVDRLISEGKLAKITKMTPKAKGITVYRSKEKNSSGDYQYFIIRNNELVKVNGIVNTNGYLMGSAGKHISNLADSDVSAFDESALPTKTVTTPATTEEAHDIGYYVAQDLVGYTNDDEYDNVKARLGKINKDNVLEFLRGYYSNNGGGNGLFLQLAVETKHFKNSVVKKVAAALLEALEEESSIQSTPEFKTARRVLKRIAERKDNDDFKMLNGDWGWGLYRIFGVDDMDQLDDAIEEILKIIDSGSSETQE